MIAGTKESDEGLFVRKILDSKIGSEYCLGLGEIGRASCRERV